MIIRPNLYTKGNRSDIIILGIINNIKQNEVNKENDNKIKLITK